MVINQEPQALIENYWWEPRNSRWFNGSCPQINPG